MEAVCVHTCMYLCMFVYLWDPPGCCWRQWALPKGGTAVTSLNPAVGAGRGYCRMRKGFHLIRGLIYTRHTTWMTQRHAIYQSSLQTHYLLPQLNLAGWNKTTKTGKGWVISITLQLHQDLKVWGWRGRSKIKRKVECQFNLYTKQTQKR